VVAGALLASPREMRVYVADGALSVPVSALRGSASLVSDVPLTATLRPSANDKYLMAMLVREPELPASFALSIREPGGRVHESTVTLSETVLAEPDAPKPIATPLPNPSAAITGVLAGVRQLERLAEADDLLKIPAGAAQIATSAEAYIAHFEEEDQERFRPAVRGLRASVEAVTQAVERDDTREVSRILREMRENYLPILTGHSPVPTTPR
jgi:hypothetical protein